MVVHLERCLHGGVTWFGRWATVLPSVRVIVWRDVRGGLPREAFETLADAESVTLVASDLQGLSHAVHYFLEKTFGVRWL